MSTASLKHPPIAPNEPPAHPHYPTRPHNAARPKWEVIDEPVANSASERTLGKG